MITFYKNIYNSLLIQDFFLRLWHFCTSSPLQGVLFTQHECYPPMIFGFQKFHTHKLMLLAKKEEKYKQRAVSLQINVKPRTPGNQEITNL